MSMKKLILAMLLPLFGVIGCSADTPVSGDNKLDGSTKTLVAYYSAQGHTRAVAEAIQEATGADIFFIEPAEPYAENPYDDSDKIQNEAYNDLRPAVKTYLSDEEMSKYDVIFVGTPCWWHQPAMVVCTFLEHYNLSGKTVIPFVTYGATTYLNETMQKLYKCTPDSRHIPATLPEDLDPDNIRTPQNDDAGIDMPTVSTVKQWLDRIGYNELVSGIEGISDRQLTDNDTYYTLSGQKISEIPDGGIYVAAGKKYIVR